MLCKWTLQWNLIQRGKEISLNESSKNREIIKFCQKSISQVKRNTVLTYNIYRI